MPTSDARSRSLTSLPTLGDVRMVAEARGFTVDAAECCPWQGALIAFSRPRHEVETFLGLPVGDERVSTEVIERNYCRPDEIAPDEVQAEAFGRACQRAIWAMEAGA